MHCSQRFRSNAWETASYRLAATEGGARRGGAVAYAMRSLWRYMAGLVQERGSGYLKSIHVGAEEMVIRWRSGELGRRATSYTCLKENQSNALHNIRRTFNNCMVRSPSRKRQKCMTCLFLLMRGRSGRDESVWTPQRFGDQCV